MKGNKALKKKYVRVQREIGDTEPLPMENHKICKFSWELASGIPWDLTNL